MFLFSSELGNMSMAWKSTEPISVLVTHRKTVHSSLRQYFNQHINCIHFSQGPSNLHSLHYRLRSKGTGVNICDYFKDCTELLPRGGEWKQRYGYFKRKKIWPLYLSILNKYCKRITLIVNSSLFLNSFVVKSISFCVIKKLIWIQTWMVSSSGVLAESVL